MCLPSLFPREVAPRYEDILAGSAVDFVRGRFTGLDDAAGAAVVQLPSGEEQRLPFDYCVLALGAKPALKAVGIPGVQESRCRTDSSLTRAVRTPNPNAL